MTKVCTLFFLTLLIVFSLGFSFSASAAKPSDFNLKDGDLISAIFSSDPDVYIVNEHGYKRLFLNPEIFKFYGHLGGFAGVKLVTPEVRDSFPTTGLFRNCEVNDLKVYGFQADNEDKGKLHWIDTPGDQAVKDDPDFFKKVFCINDREFRWYPRGQELKSVKEVPQYHRATPATPAVPATPAIPASPSHPFSPTASKSIPLTPSITPKPASGSFSPTPIPTSVAQPATPAVPAMPAQPATPAVPAMPAQPATTSSPTPTPGGVQPTAPINLMIDKGTTLHLNPPAVNYSVRFNYTLASNTESLRVYLKRPNSTMFVPYTYNAQVPLLDPSQWNNSSATPYLRRTDMASWYWWPADEFLPNADQSRFGEYKVYVTAVNMSGAESAASETKTIRIYAPPIISSPSQGSTVSTKPTITFATGDSIISGQNYAVYIYKANGVVAWSNGLASTNFVYSGTELSPSDNPHRLVLHSYAAAPNFPYWYSPFSQTTFSVSAPTPTPISSPTPTPTPEPVAFAFSNQNVNNITSNSATIIFTTNVSVAAKAALFICTKTPTSNSCASQNIFWESPNIGFSPYTYISGAHSIPVSYLKSGTTYTFQVDVFDAAYYAYTYKGEFTTPISTSTFSRDLYLGLKGNDVKQLQALLINEVNYSTDLLTGYFGSITHEAVKRLQEKYGVKPVSGYFGTITRKALNALMANHQ